MTIKTSQKVAQEPRQAAGKQQHPNSCKPIAFSLIHPCPCLQGPYKPNHQLHSHQLCKIPTAEPTLPRRKATKVPAGDSLKTLAQDPFPLITSPEVKGAAHGKGRARVPEKAARGSLKSPLRLPCLPHDGRRESRPCSRWDPGYHGCRNGQRNDVIASSSLPQGLVVWVRPLPTISKFQGRNLVRDWAGENFRIAAL